MGFCFRQNGATRREFTLWHEIKNLDKIYETMVFKTLAIRQQRIVILKGWETDDVSPVTGPVY